MTQASPPSGEPVAAVTGEGQAIVYQVNSAGLLIGTTVADESPLEPGVLHLPAGTVQQRPPEEWPEAKWPRWNGHSWDLVTRPSPKPEPTPVEKLAAFLQSNPDVQSLIASSTMSGPTPGATTHA